jgi:hypothetical protein
MSQKKPTAPPKGSQAMSEQPRHPAELETSGRQVEPLSPNFPSRREHDRHRDGLEVVVVDDGAHLSAQQRRSAHELFRLYQSLCGGQPGRYAPQSLLDTADRLGRPAFPGRSSHLPNGKNR